MEKILNKTITNIGQGEASCGVEEQFFYLKYFYNENNTANQLLYILSPPLLYSENLPIASNTFNNEYFSFRFLNQYVKNNGENKRQRIFEYVKSKFSWKWISMMPKIEDGIADSLQRIDPVAVQQAFTLIYASDKNESERRFTKSCMIIEEEIKYTIDKKTEIVFVIPPSLFGKWPGHDNTIEFAKKMQEKYGIRFYDFSEAMMEPGYYYDHHHLNTKGVVYFAKNFLKPII